MTPVDSPHVLLTRAADELADLAEHWANYERGFAEQEQMPNGVMRWDSPSEMWLYDLVDRNASRPNARWASTLSPAVAPHLVAWLRDTAHRCETQPHLSVEGSTPRKAALAFARTVLGMEAETP